MATKKTKSKAKPVKQVKAKKTETPSSEKKGKTAKGLDDITRKDILMIPFSRLEIEPEFNQRINYGDLDELADDIKSNGVLTPLRVVLKPGATDRYFVREGHRRYMALELLTKQGIDVGKVGCQPSKETREESFIKMVSANNSLPFTLLEQGLVYKQLEQFGYTAKNIQDKFGIKHIGRIYDAIKLAESPKRLHIRLAEGTISQAVVLQILRESDDNWDDAMTRIEDAVQVAEKEIAKENKIAVKEGKPKKEKKVTARHVKGIAIKTPVQKLNEAVEKAGKKPDSYVKSKVELAASFAEVLHKKGTVEEILALLEK